MMDRFQVLVFNFNLRRYDMAGIGGLFGDSIEPDPQHHQQHHHLTGFHDLSSSPSSGVPGFGFGSGAPVRPPPAAAAAAADDMFLSDEAFARRLQAEEGGISLDDPADDYGSDEVGRCRSTVSNPVVKAPAISALDTGI
jgi:hypothetical protein